MQTSSHRFQRDRSREELRGPSSSSLTRKRDEFLPRPSSLFVSFCCAGYRALDRLQCPAAVHAFQTPRCQNVKWMSNGCQIEEPIKRWILKSRHGNQAALVASWWSDLCISDYVLRIRVCELYFMELETNVLKDRESGYFGIIVSNTARTWSCGNSFGISFKVRITSSFFGVQNSLFWLVIQANSSSSDWGFEDRFGISLSPFSSMITCRLFGKGFGVTKLNIAVRELIRYVERLFGNPGLGKATVVCVGFPCVGLRSLWWPFRRSATERRCARIQRDLKRNYPHVL